jgi:hypothetical protein
MTSDPPIVSSLLTTIVFAKHCVAHIHVRKFVWCVRLRDRIPAIQKAGRLSVWRLTLNLYISGAGSPTGNRCGPWATDGPGLLIRLGPEWPVFLYAARLDRHRGGGHPPTPATRPCVRVRTRRFENVRLSLANE